MEENTQTKNNKLATLVSQKFLFGLIARNKPGKETINEGFCQGNDPHQLQQQQQQRQKA